MGLSKITCTQNIFSILRRRNMACSICDGDVDLADGGVEGTFGILPVSFCVWCLACMEDMFEQYET